MKSATAKNIKQIIIDKGLKQSAVAKKAGYSYGTLSNMLNGRKLITDVDVINISRVLCVEPNDLYGLKSSTVSKNADMAEYRTAEVKSPV